MTRFLSALEDMIEEDRGFLDDMSRIVPAHATFNFGSVPEFEEQARQIVLSWAERLAGSSFHVSMRRRGHRGERGSLSEERFLGGVILEKIVELGRAATIVFADPDFVSISRRSMTGQECRCGAERSGRGSRFSGSIEGGGNARVPIKPRRSA